MTPDDRAPVLYPPCERTTRGIHEDADGAETSSEATVGPLGVLERIRRSPLATAIGGTFIVNVIGTAAAFVAQVGLARALGHRSFGVYAYALAWVNVLAIVGKAGFDLASVRFLPVYCARREWSLVRGFMRRSVQVSALVSLALAACVAGYGALRLDVWVSAGQAALLPLSVLVMLQGATLQALGRGRASQAIQNIARPVLVMLAVVGVLYSGSSMDAPVALALNAVVTAGCCVLAWLTIRGTLPHSVFDAPPTYETRRWVRESIPFVALVAANFALDQSDILQTGWYLGADATGTYAAASRVATLIQIASGSSSIIVAPMISRLYAEKRTAELQRVVTLATWGNTVVSLVVLGLIVAAGRWVLMLFGKGFGDGWLILVVLAASRALLGALAFSGYLLSLTGRQLVAASVVIGGMLVNLAAGAILIPRYGPVGAALAMGMAILCWSTISAGLCIRLVGINPTPFVKLRDVLHRVR